MIYKGGASTFSGASSATVSNSNQAAKKPASSFNQKNYHTSNSNGDYPIFIGEHLNSCQESYEVESFLGKGTFGQVVKCRAINCGVNVAVKVLKNHPSYLRQGNVEVQILHKLNLESDTEKCHIVQAIECFQHSGHMCLVFELLELNLYEYLKMNKFRPMPLRDIRSISFQVLLALSKLKSLGLIHADLKPENIMLVEQPDINSAKRDDHMSEIKVKVIDFGSSCLSSKAVQNTYLQSRYYRAPEIILGLPFNEAIDMWSLGCVIAELYLGWPLFPGSSEYDQIRYIIQTNGLPPRDMIDSGTKAKRYFIQTTLTEQHSLGLVNSVMNSGTWRLRTPEEQFQATGQHSKEARKYILNSLDQLATLPIDSGVGDANNNYNSKTSPHSTPPSPSLLEDRFELTNLLSCMLRLSPKERIEPNDALIHNFLVGHLTGRSASIVSPFRIKEKQNLLSASHESLPYISDMLEIKPSVINSHDIRTGKLADLLMHGHVVPGDQPTNGHKMFNGITATPTTLQLTHQQEMWPQFQQMSSDSYAMPNNTHSEFAPFIANNLASPAATSQIFLQSMNNAVHTYPQQQGFLPPNVLAQSLLLSASEGVPVPPADPWMDASLDVQSEMGGMTVLNSGEMRSVPGRHNLMPQSVGSQPMNNGFAQPGLSAPHLTQSMIGQHQRANSYNPTSQKSSAGLLKDCLTRGEFAADIWSFAIQAAATRNAPLLSAASHSLSTQLGNNPAYCSGGVATSLTSRENSNVIDSRGHPLAASLTDLSGITVHKAPTAPPPLQQTTPLSGLLPANVGSHLVGSATPCVGMYGAVVPPGSNHPTPHLMPPLQQQQQQSTIQQMQLYQQFANLVAATPKGVGPIALNPYNPSSAIQQPQKFPSVSNNLFSDSLTSGNPLMCGQLAHAGNNAYPGQHFVSTASSLNSPADSNYAPLSNGIRNITDQSFYDFKDKKIPVGRVQPIIKQTNHAAPYLNQSGKPPISGPAIGQFQVLPSPHIQQSPSVNAALYQQQLNFLKLVADQQPPSSMHYPGLQHQELSTNHNLTAANAYIQNNALVLGCGHW